jgi:hypothetical protein
VADSSKKTWTSPLVQGFAVPEEIWDHYKDRLSPEALERLRAFLRVNFGFDPELAVPSRRRA